MNESYLFDIPVYRCSKKEHTKQMVRDREKYIEIDNHMISPSFEKRMGEDFDTRKWYPWRYNEIVGWIQIYRLGFQIRGRFWKIKQRISKSLKSKTFFCVGKLFEYSLDYRIANLSNEEITEIVRDQIRLGMKDTSQKNREVDWETFNNIARFFDWKKAFYQKRMSREGVRKS